MRRKPLLALFFLLSLFCPLLAEDAAKDLQPDETIHIPMRDGTRLSTDLYFPKNKRKGLPCILVRTPSGRLEYRHSYAPLAQAGYLVAIQDTRSALKEGGLSCVPWIADGWGDLQDGYDTVQWLAESPLTNGKVGTLGFSAMGITQLLVAPAAPPALCCQHIGFAAASIYDHGLYQGGQMRKMQTEKWMGQYACHPQVKALLANRNLLQRMCRQIDTRLVADRVDVPAIHYTGWYDTFLEGAIEGYSSRQREGKEGAKGRQKLVIGPWTHHWPRSYALGDFEVPEVGKQPPLDTSARSWFDHHMKGIDNGIDKLPNVLYYVMGPLDGAPSKGNVWKSADEWPLPSTETALFLGKGEDLSREPPSQGSRFASFTYDPEHPVPTLGGKNLFLESGPKDQRPIEAREDVLIFSSEPLEEDLEIAGKIRCILYALSDRPDTDIAVRLSDVYPDGRSILISDSIYRLVEKGSLIREVELDLWSMSCVFAKGHRIRLSISGSNYPRFEKNLNLDPEAPLKGVPQKSLTRIYLDKEHPSRLLLPVVSDSNF